MITPNYINFETSSYDSCITTSIQQIQDYENQITNTQNTDDETINSIIIQCKTDAMQWYNSIYPAYLNMPNTIVASSSLIDSSLEILESLTNQLKENPNSVEIRKNINNQANSLQKIVQNLQTEMNGLSVSLFSYNKNMSTDYNLYNTGIKYITDKTNNQYSSLNQSYGKLHSLQKASCPDKNAINACKQQIKSLNSQIEDSKTIYNTLSTLLNKCNLAILGSSYLASFWQEAANDALNCVNGLIKIQQDPDNLLQLDITNNINQWNEFKELMQKVDLNITS